MDCEICVKIGAERNSTNPDIIIEEILCYLECGEKQFNKNNYTNIVLVVGPTGSGKSTTVQFIANDTNKLTAVEDEDTGEFYIIDEGGSISNQTLISKTFLPELTYHSESSTAFYDCPGFDDTRKVSVEIANAFFIQRIAEKAERIKIVVVVQDSKLSTSDRTAFPRLLSQLLSLIKTTSKFSGALSLVGTMSPEGRNETQTINKYFKFLNTSVREYLSESWTEPRLEDAFFLLESFLEKNIDNSLDKLAFFRKPNQTGNLDEIPSFQENKRLLKQVILNNTDYVDTADGDFSYTISHKVKTVLINLVVTLNEFVITTTTVLGSKLTNEFTSQFIKIGSAIYANYTDLRNSVTGLRESSYPKCQKIKKLLFKDYKEEIEQNMKNFIGVLDKDCDELKKFEQYIKYLDFVKDPFDGNIAIDAERWTNPLLGLKTNVFAIINDQEKAIERSIQSAFDHASTLYLQKFHYMFNKSKDPSYDITKLGNSVDGLLRANYSKCQVDGLTIADCKREIFDNIRKFSVHLGLREEEISKLNKTIDHLQVLHYIAMQKVHKNQTSEWTRPLMNMLPSIKSYVDGNIARYIYTEIHGRLEKLAAKIETRLTLQISQSPNFETEGLMVFALQDNVSTIINVLQKKLLQQSITLETYLNFTIDTLASLNASDSEHILLIQNMYPRIRLIEKIGVVDWKNKKVWSSILNKINATLANELQWTSFLRSTYVVLSSYMVQVAKIGNMHNWRINNPSVNNNNFNVFWTKINSEFSAIREANFKNIPMMATGNRGKLEKLNILLDLTLKEAGCTYNSVDSTYVVTGYFLTFSNIINCVKGKGFKKVNMLAFHTLFMNQDTSMADINMKSPVDLFFMAPNVESSAVLNFNGANGESYFLSDGRGNAGKNAGNIFGILKTLNGRLQVTMNGGIGGTGRNGETGSSGSPGGYKSFTPTQTNHDDCAAWQNGHIRVKVYPNTCNGPTQTCEGGRDITIYGTNGTSGGKGHDGAAGGKGGFEGSYILVDVDKQTQSCTMGKRGTNGVDGRGGQGGQGGLRGGSIVAKIKSKLGIKNYYCKVENIYPDASTVRAPNGQSGLTGAKGPPAQPQPYNFDKSNYSKVIREYYQLVNKMTNQSFFNLALSQFVTKAKQNTQVPK